jgi:glyoxylate carboligase
MIKCVTNLKEKKLTSCVIAQEVSRGSFIAEARIRSQVSPCGICSGQSGIGTDFSRVLQSFLCQCHASNAPYQFIQLLPTLYNLRSLDIR